MVVVEKKRDEFDRILERVLESLPSEVSALMDEIAVIVEDEPSAEILEDLGVEPQPGDDDLCGVHTGLPLPERSMLDPAPPPTQICLFRGPIFRLAGDGKRSLAKQIRITLLHEIGHVFGFTEEKLKALGYE